MSNDRFIWILAGQSNMQGCGLRGEPLPIDPRVSSHLPEAGRQAARDPLDALEPTDRIEPGTSLGPAFGQAFAELNPAAGLIDKADAPLGAFGPTPIAR